jgi:hypothetical protein
VTVASPVVDVAGWLDRYLAIATAALDPVPGKTFIQPGGEVAWDQCDCDGQAWSRLVGIQPIVGQIRANGLPCGVQAWELQLAVGVLRCVHTVTDRGTFPTGPQITDDGHRFATDGANLLQAVTCAPYTRSIIGLTPLGPLGGCAGSEVVFTVRVNPCACPDPEPVP